MLRVLHSLFHQRLPGRAIERYLRLLPVSIRLSINKYRRWQDSQAVLLGQLLLLEGLQEAGGRPVRLDKLRRDDYGRPYLDGAIDFNISHSAGGAVCVLTAQGRVGIDLERFKPTDLPDFQAWFTRKEWTAVTAANEPLREFYRLWTAKESVLKADGRGLSLSPLDVALNGETATLDGRRWFIREIKMGDDYLCHVAANIPCSEIILSEKVF
ncbi:MAG: 4'-phosphopantetheinyl transferase superfamily protein [Desulfobacterota bacterium]|jgi:4'-phosphopantetheinyl transferase|nr:4'-phosphopantetheinyl transferase superfamily protein [Thermodesulfobacteriota bacterium]